jgi:hypothetical protein
MRERHHPGSAGHQIGDRAPGRFGASQLLELDGLVCTVLGEGDPQRDEYSKVTVPG